MSVSPDTSSIAPKTVDPWELYRQWAVQGYKRDKFGRPVFVRAPR